VVEVFFQLASKWLKWCTQTLHPFSQILKIFPRIGTPTYWQFSNLFDPLERAFLPRKNAANPHLNRPTNADAISLNNATASLVTVKPRALFTKKVKNITLHTLTPTCIVRFPPDFAWWYRWSVPSYHPQTFLGPVNSLVATGHRKFGWKRHHRGKLFIILSFIELNQPNLADFCRLRIHIKPVNFVRIAQGVRTHTAEPIKVKFGREERTYGSFLLLAKFHLDRCNMSPLRGEKPQNRPVSKNNARLWLVLLTLKTELSCKVRPSQEQMRRRWVRRLNHWATAVVLLKYML